MSSRMERYNSTSFSRVDKNRDSYNSTDISELSRIKTNSNISVISERASKEIDIDKIKNYLESVNEIKNEQRKKINFDLPEDKDVEVTRYEPRNYDINSVLEQAKDSREEKLDYESEKHRKFDTTEYDILKNIKLKKEETLNQELENDFNTQEKTIINLIQTIAGNKDDLFKDLMGEDTLDPIDEISDNEDLKNELISMTENLEYIKEPINELTHDLILEKEKLKKEAEEPKINKISDNIDKSFYTNSLSFTKSDFDGFEELEKSVNKKSFIVKLCIVIAILFLLATIFLIVNYALDLNII